MGSSEDQYDVLRFDGYYYRRILSCAPLCPTLNNSITVACQAPLSMRFFRQEYWSGLPFPPPEDLPDPRMEPVSFGSPWIGRQILYHCNQGNRLLWEKDFLYSQKLQSWQSLLLEDTVCKHEAWNHLSHFPPNKEIHLRLKTKNELGAMMILLNCWIKPVLVYYRWTIQIYKSIYPPVYFKYVSVGGVILLRNHQLRKK